MHSFDLWSMSIHYSERTHDLNEQTMNVPVLFNGMKLRDDRGYIYGDVCEAKHFSHVIHDCQVKSLPSLCS